MQSVAINRKACSVPFSLLCGLAGEPKLQQNKTNTIQLEGRIEPAASALEAEGQHSQQSSRQENLLSRAKPAAVSSLSRPAAAVALYILIGRLTPSLCTGDPDFLSSDRVAIAFFLCCCGQLQCFQSSIGFCDTKTRPPLARDDLCQETSSLLRRREFGYRLCCVHICMYTLSTSEPSTALSDALHHHGCFCDA